MADSQRNFERKLARTLGSIAILVQLLRIQPKGLHAYALWKKVEELVYTKRKQLEEPIGKTIDILQEISDLYDEAKTDLDIHSRKEKLREEIQTSFLMRHNIHLKALLGDSKDSEKDVHLETLGIILDQLKFMKDIFLESSSVWSSPSGIYPELNQLEKDEMIQEIGEEVVEGRARKIYSLTDQGKLGLRLAFMSFFEISDFLFSYDQTAFWSSEGEDIPVILLLKKMVEDLEFEESELDELSFNEDLHGSLVNALLVPGFLLSIGMQRNQERFSFIDDLIRDATSENEKLITLAFIRENLKDLQKFSSESLRYLEKFN